MKHYIYRKYIQEVAEEDVKKEDPTLKDKAKSFIEKIPPFKNAAESRELRNKLSDVEDQFKPQYDKINKKIEDLKNKKSEILDKQGKKINKYYNNNYENKSNEIKDNIEKLIDKYDSKNDTHFKLGTKLNDLKQNESDIKKSIEGDIRRSERSFVRNVGLTSVGIGSLVLGLNSIISSVRNKKLNRWLQTDCSDVTNEKEKVKCLKFVRDFKLNFYRKELAKCKDQQCIDAVNKEISNITKIR